MIDHRYVSSQERKQVRSYPLLVHVAFVVVCVHSALPSVYYSPRYKQLRYQQQQLKQKTVSPLWFYDDYFIVVNRCAWIQFFMLMLTIYFCREYTNIIRLSAITFIMLVLEATYEVFSPVYNL